MATAAAHADYQAGDDDHAGRHHGSDIEASIQVEDSQYEEISTAYSIPTKTGEEDFVNDTQLDAERPTSRGTTQSGHSDFDDEEDMKLYRSAKVRRDQTAAVNDPPATGSLLSRPALTEEPEVNINFAFTKATPRPMDFTGTRKGPVTDMPCPDSATNESAEQTIAAVDGHPQDPTQEDQQQVLELRPMPPPDVAGTADERPTAKPEARNPGKTRKKDKTKRKRRHDPTPTEKEDPNLTMAPTADTQDVPTPIEPHHVVTTDDLPTYEDAQGLGQDERYRTPVETTAEEPDQARAGSPHYQLQHELLAATQESPDTVDANLLPPEARQPQHMASEDAEPELLSPSTSGRTFPQGQRLASSNEDDDEHGLHRVSDRPRPPKVSKRKSRGSRRAANLSQPELGSASDTSDLNDFFQIIQYKVRQKEQSLTASFVAEREHLHAELQQVVDAKQMLQNELEQVFQHRDSLTAILDKQKGKVAAYESKINRFKTFVDGLGNDVDSLKKDANATRRKSELLTQEKDDRKAERDALFDELNICAERSAQLKTQALKACQETHAELQLATLRADYLDQQLGEKVGLLAEERDRRSQLERQLASVSSSDETVFRALQSNTNDILDKLYEIRGDIEEAKTNDEISDMLKSTLAAVQGLNSQVTGTADIADVKGLIEALSESLTSKIEECVALPLDEQPVFSAFEAHVDEALTRLREELGRREQLVQQDAAHRETIAGLQEKLKAFNIRITDAESQRANVVAHENALKEQNATLQARVAGLQTKSSPADNARVELIEAKGELNAKAKALESVQADLKGKVEELRSMGTANDALQSQLQTLQGRLKELERNVPDFGPERAELQRQTQGDLERVRKEMAKHTQIFETELRAELGNTLKKLTSERNRLEKQLKPMSEELAACKARIQQLQDQKSTGAATNDQELKRLTKLADTQTHEIAKLQASLNESRQSVKGVAALKEQCSALSSQLSTEKSKLQDTIEKRSALAKQNEDLQRTSGEAGFAAEQAKAELQKCQTENESQRKALEKDLAEAKEAEERSNAGLEQLRDSCKDAINDAHLKGERQVQALQDRLSEAQAELQQQKAKDEKFRTAVEQTWHKEQQEWEERTADFTRKVEELEAERNEALTNNERTREELQTTVKEQRDSLLEQIDQLRQRAEAAEKKLEAEQRPSSKGSAISSRLHVPSISAGITPTATVKATAPTKPRKKADRINNTTVDGDPIPAPEQLRSDPRRTSSAKSQKSAHGPVVEDSQLESDPFGTLSMTAAKRPANPHPFLMFSDDDDMLTVMNGGSQPLARTVAETQSEDKQQSFTAISSGLRSNPSIAKPSSLFRVPALRDSKSPDIGGQTSLLRPNNGNLTYAYRGPDQPQDEFRIYEDPQGSNGSQSQGLIDERRQLQDSLSWSQAEKDKYTFQKSFPHPNSASKLMRRASDSQRSAASGGHDSDVASVRGKGRASLSRGLYSSQIVQGTAAGSSSPDFVNATTASGRKVSTYNTPGGSVGKRGLSRTNSVPSGDPRLAGRNPPPAPKRKAAGQVVEGYEHERKKRLTSGNGQTGLTGSRARPSIHDLPTFPTVPAGPRSSQTDASSHSRMRTLGGASSRITRGTKKPSKNDEFNARFSQELGGR